MLGGHNNNVGLTTLLCGMPGHETRPSGDPMPWVIRRKQAESLGWAVGRDGLCQCALCEHWKGDPKAALCGAPVSEPGDWTAMARREDLRDGDRRRFWLKAGWWSVISPSWGASDAALHWPSSAFPVIASWIEMFSASSRGSRPFYKKTDFLWLFPTKMHHVHTQSCIFSWVQKSLRGKAQKTWGALSREQRVRRNGLFLAMVWRKEGLKHLHSVLCFDYLRIFFFKTQYKPDVTVYL